MASGNDDGNAAPPQQFGGFSGLSHMTARTRLFIVLEWRALRFAVRQQDWPQWPMTTDREFVDCEIEVADICLHGARGASEEVARLALAQALAIYVLLSDWVQLNGGDEEFEQLLKRLRWRVDAASAEIGDL